jgi:hypothetical protein
MNALIRPGAMVRCKSLGDGLVTRVSGTTVTVSLVQLEGLSVSIPVSEVELIKAAPPPKPAPQPILLTRPAKAPGKLATCEATPAEMEPAMPRPTTDPPAPPRGRTAIEALRFGLVPKAAIEELTIDYVRLADWVRAQLPAAGRLAVSEVCGPFGTGKSHTMAVIRHVAGEAGYLTAKVEIDGHRVSLSDPKSLLAHMWPTLEGRNFKSPTPLIDMYRRAIERGCPPPTVVPPGDHRYDRIKLSYTTIAHVLRRGHLDSFASEIESVLCCDGEHTANDVSYRLTRVPNIDMGQILLRAIIGQGVRDRPYDFVEAIIGTAIVSKLAGFAGIVLTIDEFEIEDSLTTQRKERVTALLDALEDGLRGKFGHPNAPLGLFFASVDAEGHIGDEVIQQLIQHTNGSRYTLASWPDSRLRELATCISSLYAETYPTRIPITDGPAPTTVKRDNSAALSDDVIRAFIKRCVAGLDVAHGPPRR